MAVKEEAINMAYESIYSPSSIHGKNARRGNNWCPYVLKEHNLIQPIEAWTLWTTDLLPNVSLEFRFRAMLSNFWPPALKCPLQLEHLFTFL